MDVIEWLLESDPAIRWQVMRDLAHSPDDAVAAERARVATEGWGAQLLALQGGDGSWAGGAHFPADFAWGQGVDQPWTATSFTLRLLRDLGVEPSNPEVRRAVARVREGVTWEHAGQRFFDGEVEPCINGLALVSGAYFGEDVSGIVDRLLGERLSDGGWNCEVENGSVVSSFDTIINVVEGLLEFEVAHGRRVDITAAREGAHEYLLKRRLMFGLRSGQVPDPAFTAFPFPARWRYDVLRALDYFRLAEVAPEPRMDEALDLVESRRGPDGRWPVEPPIKGAVHFEMEGLVGSPSRWNTLRGMRVLEWAGRVPGQR